MHRLLWSYSYLQPWKMLAFSLPKSRGKVPWLISHIFPPMCIKSVRQNWQLFASFLTLLAISRQNGKGLQHRQTFCCGRVIYMRKGAVCFLRFAFSTGKGSWSETDRNVMDIIMWHNIYIYIFLEFNGSYTSLQLSESLVEQAGGSILACGSQLKGNSFLLNLCSCPWLDQSLWEDCQTVQQKLYSCHSALLLIIIVYFPCW